MLIGEKYIKSMLMGFCFIALIHSLVIELPLFLTSADEVASVNVYF